MNFPSSKNSVFKDPKFVSKYLQKNVKKIITGLRPAPPPYGTALLPPTKVGAKYLAAAVLAHPDCALSPRNRVEKLGL